MQEQPHMTYGHTVLRIYIDHMKRSNKIFFSLLPMYPCLIHRHSQHDGGFPDKPVLQHHPGLGALVLLPVLPGTPALESVPAC